jgi:hypothetical protein
MIRVVVPQRAGEASLRELLTNSLVLKPSAVAFDISTFDATKSCMWPQIVARNRSSRHDASRRCPVDAPRHFVAPNPLSRRAAAHVFSMWSTMRRRRVQQVVFAVVVVRKLLRATKYNQAMLPVTKARR